MVAGLSEDTKLIGGKMTYELDTEDYPTGMLPGKGRNTEKELAKELTEKIAREIFDDIEELKEYAFGVPYIDHTKLQALKEKYGINT